MDEKRAIERHNLIYYMNAYHDGEYFGNCIDISIKGCKVLSKKNMEGVQFNVLELELPFPKGNHKHVKMAVEKKSVSQKPNSEFYEIGFEFINISLENSTIIDKLIEEYSIK